mmetsp:Transcript_19195/g.35081  ORF Transcript_19195/g.35081 Transcript_19195/m.35081 type:complete len:361 (+) Transcript_19195:2184-3266(+)
MTAEYKYDTFNYCDISDVPANSYEEDASQFIDFDELREDESVEECGEQIDFLYTFVSETTDSEYNKVHMALEDYRSHELRHSHEHSPKIPLLRLDFIDNYALSTEPSERKPCFDGIKSPTSNEETRQVEAMSAAIEDAINLYTKNLELDYELSFGQAAHTLQLQVTLMRLVEEQHTLNQDLRQTIQELRYQARKQRQEASIVPALTKAKTDTSRANTDRSNTKDHSLEVYKVLSEIAKLSHKSEEMSELEKKLKDLARTSDNDYKLRVTINRIKTLISKERTEKVIIESTRQTMNVTSKLCAMDSSLDRSSISINTSILSKNSSFDSDGKESLRPATRVRLTSPRNPFGTARRVVNVKLE